MPTFDEEIDAILNDGDSPLYPVVRAINRYRNEYPGTKLTTLQLKHMLERRRERLLRRKKVTQ